MKIDSLLNKVKALRAPNGCAWDKAQTHKSLRKYLIEEAYEVLELLDNIEDEKTLQKNPALKESLQDELGDLLFQVLLHAELASENSDINFQTIAENLEKKLVRRHPHVFLDKKNLSKEEIAEQWHKTKKQEKTRNSILDNIPAQLPALQRAEKVIDRVTKVGFQWPNLEGPLDKVAEELAELAEEIKNFETLKKNSSADTKLQAQKEKVAAELGDALFSLCNIAHFLAIEPENSLRTMLKRFENRFLFIEKSLEQDGKNFSQVNLEELDQYWNLAKVKERDKL